MFATAIGGFALGFIDKSIGDQLPTLPVLGRAGTIALGAWLFNRGGSSSILRDVAIAGIAIAGYQYGKEGEVSGDIPDQVHGIAAQV